MFTCLRGVLVLLIAPILTAVVSVLAIIATVVFRRPAGRVQVYPRYWARVIATLIGIEVEVVGMERLAGNRPYIFAANHQSQVDIFVLQGYFAYDFRWLAKLELFQVPVFGEGMRRAGHIPVDRAHSRNALKSLDEAAKRIADGTSVVIFPEGTRSPDGRLLPFKGGTMALAIKAGVPVVPVGISGTHEVLAKGKLLARPGKVTIRVGEPIETGGYKLKDKHELAALLQGRVAELLDNQA
ncbi:MAG: 1-acyl-sn-glycerol-3-phosphate acyltransferase [Desulfobulbaceae bacterium]|nr:1-acyl-sn-glycerol-3-phosphate acyltransferase [Desulfobulbaceae bacterium]